MDLRKERIIALVDMDCFYVQVEQKLCPEYLNKPCAVVQYNTWKGGGIIAVNYEARAKGVKRFGRGEDVLKVCPEIHLFRVPEVRGKADLTRYREAGASVLEVLCKFSDCVERASIDEAYLDLTDAINSKLKNGSHVTADQIPNTFVIGWEDALENWLQMIYEEDHLYHDRMLATAAVIVEEMRAAVLKETNFKCSAGVAHNKMLSKLACGLHKPNKQTILPQSSIPLLYKTIPINKVRNLGGKLGQHVMEKFDAKTMGDLMNLSKAQFISAFGDKTGNWLHNVSRGIENEPVTPRQLPKSIGCGKNFPGKSCLNTKEKVMHWVKQLACELEERLLRDQESNRRVARLLTVSCRNSSTPGYSTISKSCPIYVYSADKIARDAFAALQKFNSSQSSWNPAILSLAMSAGKFEDKLDVSTSDIQSYFNNAMSPSKKDHNSAQSSSNIDTVLDLIKTEPSLSKDITSINDNVAKCNSLAVKSGASSSRSKDISSFFSTQVPCTSSSEVSVQKNLKNVLNSFDETSKFNLCADNNSNVTLDGNMSPKNVQNSESSAVEPSLSLKTNDLKNDASHKPKGFFARKLEERMQSTNSGTLRHSSISSSETSNEEWSLDSFDSNKPLNSDSEISAEKSTFSSIASMFSVQNGLLSTNAELDPELTKLCPKCNRQIPLWEEEEHADYHIAFDLSKELLKNSSVQQSTSGQTFGKSAVSKPTKTNRKRGATTKSISKSKKPVQQNTLDSFFK